MEETPQEKAVSTKAETAVATKRRGHEAPVDESDLLIPRALLIQYTPPRVVKIDPKLIQPGMIINSITAQELPKDETGAIVFVPFRRTVNWVRFNAQDEDKPDFDPQFEAGAVIWKSDDPKDERVIEQGKFGPNGEPPLATKFINYFCHVPGTMPIVISFSKTSFKAGKQLTTMTQFADGDLFSWRYRLRSKEEQNDKKQKYFVLTVEQAGRASEEEYQKAEQYYTQFSSQDVKVHEFEDPASEPEKKPWE